MNKRIIIDANYPDETRIALLNEENNIEAIEYETANRHQIKCNIYLAKIVRVEPSLQAAFIEYGANRNGFLPFSEIHQDYYHIPVSDRDEKGHALALHTITPPEITSEDIAEQQGSKPSTDILEPSLDPDTLQVRDESNAVELEVADDDIESANQREAVNRQYKIQDVIKKGQIVLVQAQKEERGNKGASFSTYISLAGRYCVLMPNRPESNGISRRISSLEERKRLRDIIANLTASDTQKASVIVRTAGIGRTTYDIKRDYDYLARLWNKIREATIKSRAPAFIHMEDGIILKTIRDMLDTSVQEIMVQGTAAYHDTLEFVKSILPSDVNKVKEYRSKVPIFTKFAIEEQLANLYQPTANLPSGGYVVINPTEALISIDVNSGKATSERNIEETALKTNLEAAKEIARQLRLRDLSGLVVIDFIDMYESKNRRLLERTFRQHLSRDRARIQTGSISPFGLLEMSRQRLKSSFLEANTKVCNHCNGKGIVRADESNAILILRTIENEIFKGNFDLINVFAHIDVVLYLVNYKRKEIALIEEKCGVKCNFLNDSAATSDSFSVEKIKYPTSHNTIEAQDRPALLSSSALFDEEDSALSPSHAEEHKSVNKGSKWKNKSKTKEPQAVSAKEIVDNSPESQHLETQDKEEVASSESHKTEELLDVKEEAQEEVASTKVRHKTGRKAGPKRAKPAQRSGAKKDANGPKQQEQEA